jgi:hypothetical protein
VQAWANRGRLAAVLGLFVALPALAASNNNEAVEARMRQDITFLASAECEGRGVETQGINKAASYIADSFKKSGLKPGGVKGDWFQPFTITLMGSRKPVPSRLSLRGPLGQEIVLQEGKDFLVMGPSGSGTLKLPLVFAGYGATGRDIKYDDYQGVDVAGKGVVILRRVPRWGNDEVPFDGKSKATHAGLLNKLFNAQKHKAGAVLLVNDSSEPGDKLAGPDVIPPDAYPLNMPIVHVRRGVLDPILLSSLGSGLPELEKDIDRDLKPRTAPLAGWTADVEVKILQPTAAVKNVIGVLEGAGPLANETVVIGGHYDHLGYGGWGSLQPSVKAIHHGADDNASGTTAVLELARRFGAMKNRQGRRLVFMAFSAEERGLLGSRHYCNKEPLFPLKDTVAMVNLDMVGRLPQDPNTGKDRLIVEGTGSAKEFDELIEKLNKKHGFQLAKRPGGTGPSDHDSFYRKDVPVFFFWNGTHKDYHRPTDTADRINVPGMRKITDLAEEVVQHLATVQERPQYVKVATKPVVVPKGKGPRLGIVPDYTDDKEGVLLEDVSPDGPAAKAGLKGGDRIVEIAGQQVRNLTGLTVIMQQQQPGSTIDVVVMRGEKKITLKVTLK